MSSSTNATYELPLFPLKAVLFPGGLLNLRVFEARYLDLMTACIKTQAPFGVVHIKQGPEVHTTGDSTPQLDTVGCLARLSKWDMDTPGLMSIAAQGLQRFEILTVTTAHNGQLIASVKDMPADEAKPMPDDHAFVARGLRQLLDNMQAQQSAPSVSSSSSTSSVFMQPYDFDSPAWVSNRWCEVLPISTTAKQKLMELPDAIARLQLIGSFLKQRGIAQ
jgi:uncharacterized protein